MRPAYGETVALLRAATQGRDEYGNDIIVTARTEVPGCAIWPRSSREIEGDRATLIVGVTLLVPPGIPVGAGDQVEVRGQLYQVDGEPGLWRSFLTGYEAGTEVALRRVEG